MIKANNLKIEYATPIFENVNFGLGNNEKVGLVGLNGCGKSTLLKILTGLEEQDKGEVIINNEKIGYLPQVFDLNNEMLVGEYLESLVENHYSEMWKVDVALSKLGVKIANVDNEVNNDNLVDIDFYSEIGLLSEGLKLKLFLCKLILDESTVLLLDEPTNHLDIEGIAWLEEFLKNYPGIVIVISHDRVFLNNLVSIIFEIDENTLNIFTGNYDDYINQKIDWIQKRRDEFVLQEKKRAMLEERLKLVRKFSGGKKQGAAVKAVKSRIKREVEANEISKYTDKKISTINIDGNTHGNKTMVSIKDLDFSYPGRSIIENSNLNIYGKDKIWFYGPNGIGKSTIIKLIIGELEPDNGIAQIGENVGWRYFSQDQSHLPADMKVRDYIMTYGKIDFSRSFGVLEKFLFPDHLQEYKLSELSPGQRARLSFAVFALEENQLLILDEPTNHLDIRTKETIENALGEYDGTILLISHDRYFVDQIGINRSFTIENGVIVEG